MERFKFKLGNTKEELLDQKREIDILHEEAKTKNPECASGGCGGKCGTKECAKKMQGILNQINKAMRDQAEEI